MQGRTSHFSLDGANTSKTNCCLPWLSCVSHSHARVRRWPLQPSSCSGHRPLRCLGCPLFLMPYFETTDKSNFLPSKHIQNLRLIAGYHLVSPLPRSVMARVFTSPFSSEPSQDFHLTQDKAQVLTIPHGPHYLPPVLHTSCAACGRAASPGRSWNVLVCLHLPPRCLLHHPPYPMIPPVTFRILLNVTCLARPSLSTLVEKNCTPFPYTCCPSSLPYFSLFDMSLKLKLLFLFIVCFSAPEGKAQEGKVLLFFLFSHFDIPNI